MRKTVFTTLIVLALALPVASAEEWVIGGAVSLSYLPGTTIKNATTTGKAGLQSMASGSVFITNREKKHLSGDFWYTYRMGDLKLKSGSTTVTFGAESHLIHYDLAWHPTGSTTGFDPYFVFGAGIRYLRGNGRETANQGLNQLAVLSKTNQLLPLGTVGVGIGKTLGKRMHVRFEVRDNLSPFPDKVVFLNKQSTSSGWWHDLTAQVGVGVRF